MRILYANSHPDRSEAAIFTALKNAGHEIHAAVDPSAVRLDELKSAGIPVTPVRFKYKIDFRAVRAVRELVRLHQPDIIHTFNKRSLTNVLLATIGSDCPIIGYRGIIGNIPRWNPESHMVFFNRRLKRIICVCHAVEESLHAIGIPAEKTTTIHKGHDISWYHSADRSAFKEWNIPESSFIIGCAARMRPRKGVDILLRAVDQLNNPNVHVVLAGEITDSKVMPLIKALNLSKQVHAIGFRTDAASLMGACDICVMPSLRREGLPRSIIEAMALKTPAIVTDVGGMPELVRHGQDGLVVPPNNPGALAGAIRQLIDSTPKRLSLAASAQQRIIDSFDIASTVEQTLAVYDNARKE